MLKTTTTTSKKKKTTTSKRGGRLTVKKIEKIKATFEKNYIKKFYTNKRILTKNLTPLFIFCYHLKLFF